MIGIHFAQLHMALKLTTFMKRMNVYKNIKYTAWQKKEKENLITH